MHHIKWNDVNDAMRTTVTLAEATQPFQEKLLGHRQVTVAYLLGLAIRNKGTLVTLDRGIAALAGDDFARYVTVLE
jgi:hypothetical protein